MSPGSFPKKENGFSNRSNIPITASKKEAEIKTKPKNLLSIGNILAKKVWNRNYFYPKFVVKKIILLTNLGLLCCFF